MTEPTDQARKIERRGGFREESGPPPRFVKYHPLERGARKALDLTRRLGRRLEYQLERIERDEVAAGLERGSHGLPPKDWLETFDIYQAAIRGLLESSRKHQALMHKIHGKQLGAPDEDVPPEQEGALIVEAAAELLSDDEWARAEKLRAARAKRSP